MHNAHLADPLLWRFYRRALAKADRVICVSDYIRRSAIAHFPDHADRFSVVFNATDPATFRPYGDAARAAVAGLLEVEAGARYLLYVGRLVPDKGVHRLIEAFGAIHARDPSTRLVITGSSFVGDAARTAYQRRLARMAAPVAAAIRFTGFVPHAQLKYVYSIADLVLVPSIWQDPCPLVVLEAMAAGACVIATRVGGIPEIVDDGVTGVLVGADDAGALARAASGLLAEPARRAAIGAAARDKIIAGYTWDRLVDELERVFETL
jgi:spore coat protein SA